MSPFVYEGDPHAEEHYKNYQEKGKKLVAYTLGIKKVDIKKKKPCAICQKKERPTKMFDDHNITCLMCNEFICHRCVVARWKKAWMKADFHKSKICLEGINHEVWNCPFCRDGFDRITEISRE